MDFSGFRPHLLNIKEKRKKNFARKIYQGSQKFTRKKTKLQPFGN